MKFLRNFSQRHKFLVTRAVRDGEHCFSIMAWAGGFEYLFPSGVQRWSSVGNHQVEFFMKPFIPEIEKRAALNKPFRNDEYLKIGMWGMDSWEMTSPNAYSSRDDALRLEIPILDAERSRRPDSRWAGKNK